MLFEKAVAAFGIFGDSLLQRVESLKRVLVEVSGCQQVVSRDCDQGRIL